MFILIIQSLPFRRKYSGDFYFSCNIILESKGGNFMEFVNKQKGISEVFEPAFNTIKDKQVATFGPISFIDYLENNGIPKTGATPTAISIDSYERLHQSAKKHSAMIMRLGQTQGGTGTQFALVKLQDKLDAFFLKDDEIFKSEGIVYSDCQY